MKLVHASIPADDPKATAHVLADIMEGEALPFPPGGPDAWMAWSGNGDLELEIVRRGNLLHCDDGQGNWRPVGGAPRGSEVHLAIAVDRPAGEIADIAAAAGWPARHCSRGNGIFDLVEVWIDGCFMIEFMDRAQSAHYEKVITPHSWKQFLGAMGVELNA